MVIGRTLTKRLQKFNVVGRKSRSNSTNTSPSSEASPQISHSASSNNHNNNCNGDYFYSISFEQTAEGSDVECESVKSTSDESSSREPVTPSSIAEYQAKVYNSESPQLIEAEPVFAKVRERTNTNPPQFYPPPRRVMTDSSSVSSIYSSSVTNSPSLNEDALFINEPTDNNAEGVTIGTVNDTDLHPAELRKLEEDAKADEMAMNILEKVSADDYVRQLKTGSWYI